MTDYADNLVFLMNTADLAESLQHILEQAARGIALYMNANKTVQKGAISTQSGKPLKLVD